MSYTDKVINRNMTERGRLYQIESSQSSRNRIERKIRKKLKKIEVQIRENSDDVHMEMKKLDQLFEEFMRLHAKCMMLLNGDSEVCISDEFVERLDKDVHYLKRIYYEWISSPKQLQKKEILEKQQQDIFMEVPTDLQSTCTKRTKGSKSEKSTKTLSTKSRQSSVIQEAVLKEKTRLAELKLEAEFMVKREEVLQRQRLIEKELEIAKAEARIQIYEEDHSSKTSSLYSLPVQNKKEFVDNYLDEHVRTLDTGQKVKTEPKVDNNEVSSLIQALQLPEVEIDVFNGNVLNFWFFMTSFIETVESRTKDQKARLIRLLKYLSGEPKELVQGCIYLPASSCYNEAKRLLSEQYGNSYRILNEYKKQLKLWPKLKANDSSSLREFFTFITKFKTTMSYDGTIHDNPDIIQLLHSKLPTYIQDRWNRTALKIRKFKQRDPKLADFLELLEQEMHLATDPLYSREATESIQQRTEKPSFKRYSNLKALHATTNIVCPMCDSSHDLDECIKFLQNTIEDRRKILFKKRLCFCCYQPTSTNHSAKTCTNRRICTICSKEHPTGLHGFVKKDSPKDVKDQSKERKFYAPVKSNRTTLDAIVVSLCVVPVTLHYKSRSINTYALLDNGSQASFLRNDIANHLGVEYTPTKLRIKTLIGEQTSNCKLITDIQISNVNNSQRIDLPTCYTQDEIPIDQDEIPTPRKIKPWKHLSHLSQYLPQDDVDVEIGILLGGNCPAALEPISVIPSTTNSPYAFETKIGWCIMGPITGKSSHLYSCNKIAVVDAADGNISKHYFCIPNKVIDQSITDNLVRMYQHDFNEPGDNSLTKSTSQDDVKFLQLMNECIVKSNGHYQLPLPLKNQNVKFQNNKSQAYQRAEWLKKKLLRHSKMHEHYITFMNDLLSKGFASKVDNENLVAPPGDVWYLPHFGVYHPDKPNKVRVVLDCSASYKGSCLNQELLQGPDLTNKLLGVLLRFRMDQVAIMADIEAMFYQVKVPQDQHNYLRFLWWPDGNLNAQLQEYAMAVHVFGATSSPSVASFALKRTATDYESEFGKEAADTLRKSFYVDDLLKSYSNANIAINQLSNIVHMCSKGGFRLTKVVSNSREVLKAVPVEERGKSIKEFDMSTDTLPIEKALGIHWCIESDNLCFRIILKDKPLTRRGILSTISSIYDPLGLAAPFVLRGKLLLQQLVLDKKGWDESLGNEHTSAWEQWRRDLPSLESISVKRCYIPNDFGSVKSYTVHHFSDASDSAYGQSSYLRVENDKGDIHCTLLIGKSRVAPIKPTTIPRLELTAATVSVKVAVFLKNELPYEKLQHFYWTDSEVVLGYIRNQKKRFHLFVTNRVQTILNHTKQDQWRHVKSEDNPADDASRGLSIKSFTKNQRWFKGPNFLHQPIHTILTIDKDVTVLESDPEVKVNKVMIKEEKTLLSTLTDRTNKWSKLKRIVCHILQLKTKKSIIELKDLNDAEVKIIKLAQKEFFQQEIDDITRGKNIAKSSSIIALNPFLDSNNVLKVGGRLSNSSLDPKLIHPVILPKKSKVTLLIATECHEAMQHSGRGMTINEIRSRGYWIINCNTVVRQMISKCITCRKLRANTSNQMMANLPKERIEDTPPFTVCGVDYFGPFTIKERRKELKRYGVIFTCFNSRAVHIETSISLDTDSFIQALRRFIARRGNVRKLYSDNGTNFVGAQRELQEAINEMNDEQINAFLQLHDGEWMKWKRNPPSASHFGGVWERQIRSIRSVFNSILLNHGSSLNDESLRTFMCETEAIINSRPLTTETLSDVDGPLPLSPSNLLTMKSKVVAPPPGNFERSDTFSRKRWRRVQHLLNEFWSRWRKEYLQNIQIRSKWNESKRSIQVGDVVLLKDYYEFRNNWKLFIVEETMSDTNGLVRTVVVRNSSGQRLKRPIHKLVLLIENDSSPRSQ